MIFFKSYKHNPSNYKYNFYLFRQSSLNILNLCYACVWKYQATIIIFHDSESCIYIYVTLQSLSILRTCPVSHDVKYYWISFISTSKYSGFYRSFTSLYNSLYTCIFVNCFHYLKSKMKENSWKSERIRNTQKRCIFESSERS